MINMTRTGLIICLYKMVENHQEEENDADNVAEHGQLDV